MPTSDELINRAAQARREQRLEDARRDYAAAVEVCRQSGLQRDLARALKGLGQVERDGGRSSRALAHYKEAESNCREIDEPLLLAHTLRHIGDIYLEYGRALKAELAYREALMIYRDHDQTAPLDLANALRSLANLTERIGTREVARPFWQEACDLYARAGVWTGVAECASHLDEMRR